MLDRAYRLRYQVYCLEENFLPSDRYPDGRESDEHDEESAHFGAFDRADEMTGYVRLVQPGLQRFPFEAHCQQLLNDGALPERGEAAEISRLMLRRDVRRGQHDAAFRPGHDAPPLPAWRRPSASSDILLRLYRQMYGYSLDSDIRYWYAAMECTLARSLARWNFPFRQIGAQTDYFGPVALYLLDLRELESTLQARDPALLAWLQKREPSRARQEADADRDWRVHHLPRRGSRAATPSLAGLAGEHERGPTRHQLRRAMAT